MIFFCTALKVAYVLNPYLPEIPPPNDDDSEALKRQRKKREEDQVVFRGHILNTLLDTLYDLFTTVNLPKKIRDTLECQHVDQKQDSISFLLKNILSSNL